MTKGKNIDHLFRHQYGKMVSILTRIFGLQQLPIIEDAVQDTFVSAIKSWRNGMPENPEAWLTAAAKNRVVDLFRQIDTKNQRHEQYSSGPSTIALNELFLDTEIADSQLRMIFAACNPILKPQDQIAFALKTISGFSAGEIASALLLKEETVKKRLLRARKSISEQNIAFEIPTGDHLQPRLSRAMEVIYLIFNEGFHSSKKEVIIREDLCGEAIRLCKLLLSNPHTASGDAYALFALFCYHSARLRSKVDENNEIISLKDQDRSAWYQPIIEHGHRAMHEAIKSEFWIYHYEAAIAAEHVFAKSYPQTNWSKILTYYQKLQEIEPSSFNQLNMATVLLQLSEFDKANKLLKKIDPESLEQRVYLYHGLWAEYFKMLGDKKQGLASIELAIHSVKNQSEEKYLEKKKAQLLNLP